MIRLSVFQYMLHILRRSAIIRLFIIFGRYADAIIADVTLLLFCLPEPVL